MIEPVIGTGDLERWADILVSHSLGGVAPGERVMIKGERIGWPLMEVLERRVIASGGIPDVYVVAPNNDRGRVWSAAMGRLGSAEQLAAAPEWHRTRYETMDKYVEVLGAEDPERFRHLTAEEVRALAAADRPFADARLARRWVITLYPTPAFAAMEGLSLEEYTAFIVRASTTDPAPLRDAEERLAPLLREGRTVTVVTTDPRDGRELTLSLSIAPSLPVLSYGLRNFPDGEIFTSPDARSAEGAIHLDLPVSYGGNDIQGITLAFAGGRIVDYRAAAGHEHLAAIVETDDGSHRLGEVALGMNPGLDRVLKHPLFVEKVGGTLHVAIGASYENCYEGAGAPGAAGRARVAELEREGILNRSAQHVDIVTDFRPGGCGRRVFVDDTELAVRDGVWVPA